MNLAILKKIRVIVSIIFIFAISIVFLDISFTIQPYFSQYPLYLQFIPSLLKFLSIGSIATFGFIFVIFLSLLFGRVYCSSICPLGILQDVFTFIRNKFKIKKYLYTKPLTKTRYFFLIISIVSFLIGTTVGLNLLDPYSNFGRIINNIVRPIIIGIKNIIVFVFESLNIYVLAPIEFKGVSLFSLMFSISILGLILFLSIKYGRLYCNSVCPVGTFLGILSKISFFKIGIIEDNCIKCGECEVICKSNCIDSENEIVDFSRCVGCFNCFDVCPSTGISYLPRYSKSKSEIPNSDKRYFIKSLAILTIGAERILKAQQKIEIYKDSTKPILRKFPVSPPGSISISNFTDNCTACHLCVASCPTQVLQPAFLEYGLLGIMQPRMDFKTGFCNYDCVACLSVCPSGAILPKDIDEKKTIQLGKSKLVKENCVVYTEKTDCGACAEHCPTKAVKMQLDPEINKKAPIITEELCIGCGACEYACPTKPYKSIYIESSAIHGIAQIPKQEKIEQKIDYKEEFPF
ncbi:MAG: 4Fe-4S binding protein [Bacteroidetes bacterium]|nr:4Fe-4S binding protein [Bacteroidota bacterium]MBU1115365.1 4Fe-4S binding protein [Bacteroidota bacterium]